MGLKYQTKTVSLFTRIHPLQFQLAVRQRHLVVEVVALLLDLRDVHGDGTPAEEHPDVAVLWKRRQAGNMKANMFLCLRSFPEQVRKKNGFYYPFSLVSQKRREELGSLTQDLQHTAGDSEMF